MGFDERRGCEGVCKGLALISRRLYLSEEDAVCESLVTTTFKSVGDETPWIGDVGRVMRRPVNASIVRAGSALGEEI
jgi:hypothetical protein